MKPVLVLQHIWADPPGSLGEMMQEHAIPFDVLQVGETTIPDPAAYAAIIALGGREYAAGDAEYPVLTAEKACIRRAVEQDIPFLGICLGGQLLANAFGGPVLRDHKVEIGFYLVHLTGEGKNDVLFQGLPAYKQVFQWHNDIFNVPPGGTLLAQSSDGLPQAFRYGQRAYGLQYHIEATRHLLDLWLQEHPDKQKAIELLGQEGYEQIEQDRAALFPVYQEHTRILFENFLRLSELI